ncbi:MAG TPA: glycosyltransferase family 4 protein [Amycolatopsis sp.]|nr:glycosyltransferase family 4 protein [Amycolatopsis sp.]
MSVTFVLPADVADAAMPSGGNVYDRRVAAGLTAAGRGVCGVLVAGAWPRPAAEETRALADALARSPAGAVVLLDGLVACGVPEVVVPQAHRLRLIVLVHMPLSFAVGLAPAEAAELDARERETLRAARAVVTTSPWTADWLIHHHELTAETVHVAVPGVDRAPLAPGTDGVSRLLCVGSVTPGKGQDLLVDALAGLAEAPWTCECVGSVRRDPGYVARVRELIARRGLSARISLPGPRTGDALELAYAAADLVVVPSRAEMYGMVVTEALSHGIPVLATGVQGVPETLGRAADGSVPGILVAADDAVALAGGLGRWFSDEGLRRRLRRSARLRRDKLPSWDETVRRVALALDEAAG